MEKVIGHPLDAKVVITRAPDEYEVLTKHGDELKEVLIVSQVEVEKGDQTEVRC